MFNDPEEAIYHFEFGVDFGFGGAAFVNGFWVESRTDDLWWAGNWNSEDVLKFPVYSKVGLNSVEVYGGEGCCDG
jgi:hypothetical protein